MTSGIQISEIDSAVIDGMNGGTVKTYRQLLRYAGAAIWISLLFPTRIQPAARDAFSHADHKTLWWCLWVIFLVFFWVSLTNFIKSTAAQLSLCFTCSIIVMYFSWLQPGSPINVGLIVICWQVALLFSNRLAVFWIIVQGVLHLGINFNFSPTEVMNTLSHTMLFAFNSFTAVIVMMAKEEVNLRVAQAFSNSQLKATQELLAESSRANERLRISRELHDAIGHRLTALYLHLELASNRCNDIEIRKIIQKGQDVSQELLADVRDVVRTLRKTSGVELTGALQALATDLPGLKLYLDAPAQLNIRGPEQANALVRCVQEIITNTMKHSGASQLWVKVTFSEARVIVTAHDDGVASEESEEIGLGLHGMRERFHELGGDVEIVRERGRGVTIRALLPLRETDDHSYLG